MAGGSPRSPVSIEREGPTVRVGDDIEGAEVTIELDREPALEPALSDVFLFPVDEAVSVTVSQLRLRETFGQTIWDEDGNQVGVIADGLADLPRGTYHASITGAVKLHLRIEDAAVTAEEYLEGAGRSIVELRFDEETRVAIGARSLRSHPTGTITVPDDPEALLEALPYLASSIKEFTCERSWPTIRQHPPAIERGDRLDVPADLRAPETGIEIHIPATYGHCYRVAPLAFYLGADLRAGDAPELVLENGHVEPLETKRASLSERVADLLGRCLLLDSLVREAGYQPMASAEYDQLAGELPFYPPNLYDLSPADQLLEYLEVPGDVLAPFRARWPKRAVLRPDPADVSVLPPLLHELARIDVARSPSAVPPTTPSGTDGGNAPGDEGLPIETGRTDDGSAGEATPVDERGGGGRRRPNALLTAHTFSARVPGTCRLRPEAMERARTVERPPPERARLTLATADPGRAAAFRRFADRNHHDTDVVVLEGPSASTLRDAFVADGTALYIDLPATADGIRCPDRTLAFEAVSDVGAPVVWLAGAAPETDGEALIDAGAIAVALTSDAPDRTTVWGVLAQLLEGFSVADAVYTACVDREVDVRFDGEASVTVVRRVSKSPVVFDVTAAGPDRYDFTVCCYPTDVVRQGAAVKPLGTEGVVGRVIEECNHDGYWLVGADADQPLPITRAEVASLVEHDGFTVRLDGRLCSTVDDEALQSLGVARGTGRD
ncbi:hypothetical protein [Halovivax limisalsi]|uniref:hypothetical protein n=1 Tax=Halovivax limisalsi TaxID=1453760 RepID=UPI001FFD54CB|nr:hypothetical protein [Halovivax limisalsi]